MTIIIIIGVIFTKKNIIIIMIATISLGLTIYITFRKINTNEQNKNEQLTEEELGENDKIVEDNNEFTNKNSELKEIKRCLVYVEETDNVKRYYFGGLKMIQSLTGLKMSLNWQK